MRSLKPWLALACCIAAGASAHAAAPNALVVFGDSYSDTGLVWNRLQSTTGSNLPQSPYYVNGRFSNGPVAVEYMAQALNVPLDDRAWGGATTGVDNLLDIGGELADTGVLSQVTHYVAVQAGTPLDGQSLYTLWAGANDLILSPDPATPALASGQLMQALDVLYAAGARSFFVPALPDMSRMPLINQLGSTGLYQQLSADFNARLQDAIQTSRAAHPDASIQTFDTAGYLDAMLAEPGSGLTDQVTACIKGDFARVTAVCANPQEHVYWDGTHFTTGVHARLGGAFAAAVPEASSGLYTALGLGGLAVLSFLARSRTAKGVSPVHLRTARWKELGSA